MSLGLAYTTIRTAETAEKRGKAPRHFLRDFPVLARPRLRTLGKTFFEDFREVSIFRRGKLLSFVNAMGCL